MAGTCGAASKAPTLQISFNLRTLSIFTNNIPKWPGYYASRRVTGFFWQVIT